MNEQGLTFIIVLAAMFAVVVAVAFGLQTLLAQVTVGLALP